MPDALEPDPVLIAAVDLARAAVLEHTDPATVGEPLGYTVEGDHLVTFRFASLAAGYPGWNWTVTLARADGDAPTTVLESELMPGENALLAPDWTPWSVRLAEYEAAQAGTEVGADEDESDDSDDDDESDDDESDDDDDEVDGALHSGDIDGVDIDDSEGTD